MTCGLSLENFDEFAKRDSVGRCLKAGTKLHLVKEKKLVVNLGEKKLK